MKRIDMRFPAAIFQIIPTTLAGLLSFAGVFASTPVYAELSVIGYELVNRQIVSRLEYVLTYRVELSNSGEALSDVKGLVESPLSHVTVLDGEAKFGDMPAGSSAISTDTITLRHNRSAAFNESDLIWQFSFTPGMPVNTPPSAHAGQDQTILPGMQVSLDGSASSDLDGDLLSFQWSFDALPAGSSAILFDSSAVKPVFDADLPGEYRLSLIVNDGAQDSAPDQVTISTNNSAPVAVAGPDQSIVVSQSAFLDGSASFDVDNDALSYDWSLAQIPPGSAATLDNANLPNPSFYVDRDGDYVAELIVGDALSDSAPDRVTLSTVNTRPLANAGPDQVVGFEPVVLDGSASRDADADPLTYRWALIARPSDSTASLINPDIFNPTLTPDVAGLYVVQLIVNDGTRESAPDTAVLTVDVTPPSLTITAPADGALLNTATPAIAIDYADDGTGVDPDSLAAIANGEVISLNCTHRSDGADCVPVIALEDGPYSLEVTIADLAGNRAAPENVDFSIDTVGPHITVTSPAIFVTNLMTQTLSGNIDEPGEVTVNGTALSIDAALNFSYGPFLLEEGDNDYLFIATDLAGNSTELLFTLTLDTLPPAQPNDALITTQDEGDGTISVNGAQGAVEAGATVIVTNIATGESVSVQANGDGSFSASIASAPGDTLSVSLQDRAGNLSPTLALELINLPPVIAAVTNQTVMLGQTLSLTLQASDPEGQSVSYSIAPLPANASLNGITGVLTFRPDETQIGDHTLTLSVSDGLASTATAFTVTVTPPAIASTGLKGVLLDANAYAAGDTVPIVGATVSVLDSGVSAVTDNTGAFTLTGIPPETSILDIDAGTASLAPDGSIYADFRERYPFLPNVVIEESRPFFLPRIAAQSLTTVNPAATTTVTHTGLDVSITVPPNTALAEDGSLFTGQLSISEVPRGFAPAELPDTLDPALLVTIQPVGVTFDPPVPLTFPNIDNLPAGSEVDLWSLDPETGQFNVVGLGRVSSNAQLIETIEGGVIAADWHGFLPPAPENDDSNADSENNDPNCEPVGSVICLRSGRMSRGVTLPSYQSLETSRAVTLRYQSDHAFPRPAIAFQPTILARSAVPESVSYELTVAGIQQGSEAFITTQGLSESLDETLHSTLVFNASALPTGRHIYSGRMTSNFASSRVGADIVNYVPVVNRIDSPYGAGWAVEGLAQLMQAADGSVTIFEADGKSVTFQPSGSGVSIEGEAIFSDDFELDAASNWSNNKTTFNEAIGTFLGDFGHETVSLDLSGLGPHRAVKLELDFTAFDFWFGSEIPGFEAFFQVGSGSELTDILNHTFSNFEEAAQTYRATEPSLFGSIIFEDQEVGQNSLYSNLAGGFVIPHEQSALTLNFSGNEIQLQEFPRSWGIDNVRVSLLEKTFGLSDITYSGDIEPVAVPANTRLNALESNTVMRVFNEGHFITTANDIALDMSEPGTYTGGVGLTPSILSANNILNSYLVHFDTVGGVQRTVSATLTFDEPILGVVFTENNLVASDGLLGNVLTSYDTVFSTRGVEDNGSDIVTWETDGRTLNLTLRVNVFLDQVRVITAAGDLSDITTFTAPDGDFSTLTRTDSGFERRLKNGTRILFDEQGRQSAVIDRNGNTTGYAYDTEGRLLTITDPMMLVTNFVYSGDLLSAIIDPAGRTTGFVHDSAGNLIQVTYPDSTAEQFSYDARHLMLSATDERQHTTRYSYSEFGRLKEVELPDQRVRKANVMDEVGLLGLNGGNDSANPGAYARPDDHRVVLTDARGFERSYALDALNRPTEMIDQVARTTAHIRNADGKPIQTTRPNESVITRSYDDLGNRLIRQEQFNTATVTQTFDSDYSLVTSVTNPRENTLTINRDEFGNPVEIINALGHTTTYEYDSRGLVTRMVDPVGLETTYSYNAQGLLETLTETPPSGPGAVRVSRFEYNNAGLMSRAVTPAGVTLDYTYDERSRLLGTTDNLGQSITLTYDAYGNVISRETNDPDGTLVRLVEQVYDARNRLVQTRQPHTDDADSTTQITLDEEYNPVAQLDPRDSLSADVYDPANRLIQSTDRLDGISSYTYDTNDRITSITAPNGVVTTFVYDVLGRLLEEHSPDRGTLTYTYDLADNVTSITDGRGITATYSYDNLERVTSVTYPDATENVTYSYDNCTLGTGLICARTDEAGTDTYEYDAFGNVVAMTHTELGVTYNMGYSYDGDDNVIATTYPSGRVVNYARDEVRRISAIDTIVNGSPVTIVGNVTYRADNLMTQCSFGNGLVDNRAYDQQGRLISQLTGSIDERLYSYDPNSNLIERDTTPQLSTYAYDLKDRLVTDRFDAANLSFTYDPNDNRLLKIDGGAVENYSYQSETNRIAGIEAATRQYDQAGNLIDDGLGRTYAYNDAGRLFEVYTNGTLTATYIYNALGQRTRKLVNGGQSFIYHYNHYGQLISETLSDGTPVRDYVWLNDAPVAQIDIDAGTETLVYLHTDHLTTPRFATDATGQLVWRWEGDGFGATLPDEDADGNGQNTVVNLRFPGQYLDSETGLHYNWNRYYNPSTGRYLISDPIGLEGGLNTYLYAEANPVRFIDPTGETAIALPLFPPIAEGLKWCAATLTFIAITAICGDEDGCFGGDDDDPSCDEHFTRCLDSSLADLPGSVYGSSRCGVCRDQCVRNGGTWPDIAITGSGSVRCDYWNFQ